VPGVWEGLQGSLDAALDARARLRLRAAPPIDFLDASIRWADGLARSAA